MWRLAGWRWVAGAAIAALLAACASGPQFNGTEYRSDQVSFRLGPLPPGFRRIQTDEALLGFQNSDAGDTIAVNARCGLDGDDVPLQALVNHLFLQFTAREKVSERSFKLDGRDALEVELDAALDGVKRRFLIIVMKKDGCVYDFVLVSPRALSDSDKSQFHGMVEGFGTLR